MELTAYLERQISRVAYRLGYHLIPVNPLDLRGVTDSPIEAAIVAGRRSYVIEVPLAHCRGAIGFPYTQETLQPFVRTVRAYLAGEASNYQDSPLKEYYDSVQPKNAWELLGLAGEPNPKFLEYPPFAFLLPWESVSLEEKSRNRPLSLRRENIERGADLGIAHGDGVGPITLEKGTLEFQALARLADSIRKKGYIRDSGKDGDISGLPLIDSEGEARYLVRKGKHRIAVLTALGFERVSVRVGFKTLTPAQASHWRHVRDGLFTREQALSLFERIFEGRPPKIAIPRQWAEAYSEAWPELTGEGARPVKRQQKNRQSRC
jgi:hypothetical protein